MLAPRDLTQFARVCTAIANDAADPNGFVPLRSLLKRLGARLLTRPLLVEGVIVSNEKSGERNDSHCRWTVILDSETHQVTDTDLDSEKWGRPLASRLRNTVAHELVHTLAYSFTEFGIKLDKRYQQATNPAQLVNQIERDTEELSPLLLVTRGAIERLIATKKSILTLSEINMFRKSLGISCFVLVGRLGLLKRIPDDKELLVRDGLRGIAIGVGQWDASMEPVLQSWHLFHNFDRNVLPSLLHKLIRQRLLRVSELTTNETLTVYGGPKTSVVLSVQSGASKTAIRPDMQIEIAFEKKPPVVNSSFLYVIRNQSDPKEEAQDDEQNEFRWG